MSQTLYLHVGFQKTGSSSIQYALYHNRDKLESMGYYYPKDWRFNHNFLFSMFCDNPEDFYENIFHNRSIQDIEEYHQTLKSTFVNEIKDKKISNLILSAEDLSMLEKEGLVRLKEYFSKMFSDIEFKVVVSIRDAISYISSDIQQRIKSGHDRFPLEEFHDLYRVRLEKFVELFGVENVIIYKFEEATGYKHGFVSYFLDQIGLQEEQIKSFDDLKINESLSYEAADLLRYINTQKPLLVSRNIEEGRYFGMDNGRYFGDTQIIEGLLGQKFSLEQDEFEDIQSFIKPDMEWLEVNFAMKYSLELSNNQNPKIQIDKSYIDFFIENYFDLNVDIQNLCFSYWEAKLKSQTLAQQEVGMLNRLFDFIGEMRGFKQSFANLKMLPLSSQEADVLREVALSFEQLGDIQTAYRVMEQAYKLQPHSSMIRQKFEEYQNLLRLVK
ncbi:MAG: hypothetical protein U9N49_10585 [Campylobacterota bacterium]|nr:hypothetical protein [Campylobacterota bacterium]